MINIDSGHLAAGTSASGTASAGPVTCQVEAVAQSRVVPPVQDCDRLSKCPSSPASVRGKSQTFLGP